MRTTLHPDAAVPTDNNSPASEKRPVVLIAEALGSDRGGAEIYLTRLVDLLAKNGHPVEVFVRQPWLDAVDSKVRVEVVPTVRRMRIVWERRFAARIARRMNGPREVVLSTFPLPGITHYQPHSGLYRDNFDAVHQSMEPGLSRTIYGLGNGLNFRRHSLVKMQEQLLGGPHAPKVMTFSRRFRTRLLDLYPNLAPSVVTVPLGVDLERFQPGREPLNRWFPDRKPGQLTLLFAGHNFRLKGLRSLLLAMRDAVKRGLNATLLVVGNRGGNNRAFPPIAGLLGLSSQVRFLGSVPDSEMPSIYRSCDALVHPTYSDHCSLVALEALACGLPVVTTRQNGAAELIEAGQEGFILDHANNVQALTDTLLLLQDRAKLAAMSAAAMKLRPRIDFATHAQQVLTWLTASQGPAL